MTKLFTFTEFDAADSEGKLVKGVTYGQHFGLTCKNHPTMSWSTKNIAPLGARSIFFNDDGVECDCPMADLRPIARKESA